jgi:uncharacterized membrane protein
MRILRELETRVLRSTYKSKHVDTHAIRVNIFGYTELVHLNGKLVFLDDSGYAYSIFSDCTLEDLIDVLNSCID